MFNITEAKQKRSKVMNDAEAIRALAVKEDRLLTEAEDVQINALIEESELISNQIDIAQKELDQFERLEKVKARAQDTHKERITREKERIHISAIPDWIDDPKSGYRHAHDFYKDVIDAGKGKQTTDKLRFLNAVGSDEQSGINDPFGGFLVPDGFSPELMSVTPDGDPTVGRTADIPMATSTLHLNALVDKTHTTSVSGGITVARRAETTAVTASRQQYEQIILRAVGLFGLTYVTEELLEDSAISLAAILARGFQTEFTSKTINEKINGTGAGEPLGVLNSAAKITVTRGTTNTIVAADIYAMRSRCWGYSNAIWIANHDTYPSLATISGGDSANIYQVNVIEDRPDLLLGRPIFYSEYASTLADTGDLILCDWSQYIVGNYRPLQNASSIHVRFSNHERAFKWWLRNDSRPWWTAALTPKNGATMSPIVVLNTDT